MSTVSIVGNVHEAALSTYQLYVPDSHTPESDVLVVVHGEPGETEDVVALAETFITRWVDFAEDTGALIVAPAFNQLDFGSHGDGFGGYRGLYGRVVGADDHLHHILDHVAWITSVPAGDRPFFLYGHSAGGQFVSRYLARHPDRVHAAVLSAPGRYAFPDPDETWHFGMGRIQRTIIWRLADDKQEIDITPDPDAWVKAATLPITVVVGDEDLDDLTCIPAQCDPSWGGTATRIQIGRRWVDVMNALAAEHDRVGRVRFDVVRGVGHNSEGLTDACQRAFVPHLTPTVPDVVGMPRGDATAALEKVALRARVGRQRLSDRPRGEVIGQRADAGAVARRGTEVVLDISLGEREEAPHEVPNVVGMRETDALAALRAEGFETRLTFADDDRPAGVVIHQRPAGGETAVPGTEVHLVASLGPGDFEPQ